MSLATSLLIWLPCEESGSPLVNAINSGEQLAALSPSTWSPTYQVSSPIGYGARAVSSTGGGWKYGTGSSNYYSANYTIAGWVKVTTWPTSLTLYVLAADGDSPALRLELSSGVVSLKLRTSGGATTLSHDTAEDFSQWVHVAAVVTTTPSGSAGSKLYINGEEVAATSSTPFWQNGSQTSSLEAGNVTVSSGQTVDYSISGLGWWQRALSADEVATLAAGASYPFAGLRAHQLSASVGYGLESAAQLAGLRAHQLGAAVGYGLESAAQLAGLRAHQLGASVGYGLETATDLAGIRVHQVAVAIGYTTEPLGWHAPTAEAVIEQDAVSSGITAPTAEASCEIAAATPPLTLVPAPAEVSLAAATPPLTMSAAAGVVAIEASYFGTRAPTATATVSISNATPPLVLSAASGTVSISNATPPLVLSAATGTVSTGSVVSPLTLSAATGTIGTDQVAGLWFFVFPTLVKSQLGSGMVFKQETHNRITATLKNEHGELLYESDFDLLLATIRSVKPVGFLRKPENARGLIELSAGSFEWMLIPRDTRLLDDARASGNESHVALVEFLHAAERLDALVDPFSATNGSLTLTVAHAAHGLAVGDHVAFDAANEVGGIALSGLYIVEGVVDANSYTVLLHSAPTSTATGGGDVIAFVRPVANKWEINHSASKADFM